MRLDLSGKKALVCGGSSGIGKAIALNLAKQGCKTTILARNENKIIATIDELMLMSNINHNYIQADLNNTKESVHALKLFIKKNGSFDIFINSVGGPNSKNLYECSDVDFQEVFTIHFLSIFNFLKVLLPYMKKNSFGRIVNILGTSVLIPSSFLAKSIPRNSILNLIKLISWEYGKFQITANNIIAGPTNTDELMAIIQLQANKANIQIDEFKKKVIDKLAIKRFANPVEIADLVVYLVSENAGYITGSEIKIDGGYSNQIM